MSDFDGISEFHKVAIHRLNDAFELLETPTYNIKEGSADNRHLRAAVYLAGYAVECALKEYIISRTPPAQTLSEALTYMEAKGMNAELLSGSAGHNLLRLLAVTDLHTYLKSDPSVKKAWGECLKWRSTWRYNALAPTREYAVSFVESVQIIYRWISVHRS